MVRRALTGRAVGRSVAKLCDGSGCGSVQTQDLGWGLDTGWFVSCKEEYQPLDKREIKPRRRWAMVGRRFKRTKRRRKMALRKVEQWSEAAGEPRAGAV